MPPGGRAVRTAQLSVRAYRRAHDHVRDNARHQGSVVDTVAWSSASLEPSASRGDRARRGRRKRGSPLERPCCEARVQVGPLWSIGRSAPGVESAGTSAMNRRLGGPGADTELAMGGPDAPDHATPL